MHITKRAGLRVLSVAAGVMVGPCVGWNVAYAASATDAPSLRVSVKDLNLTNREGAATAYARIHNAARSVCGSVDTVFLEEKAAWDACVDKAIGSAVAKLGSSKLWDYYLAKTHPAHLIRTVEISKAAVPVR